MVNLIYNKWDQECLRKKTLRKDFGHGSLTGQIPMRAPSMLVEIVHSPRACSSSAILKTFTSGELGKGVDRMHCWVQCITLLRIKNKIVNIRTLKLDGYC